MENKETRVRFGISLMVNMGNYENFKVDLHLDDYVREGETVGQAYARVANWVQNQIEAKALELEEAFK